MLPIKKIYIDSRFKSSDSASHSDFKIDLPISFLMPEDTGFYIDDVCIPHTWYPISERNNLVAFKYSNTNYFAYVTPGNFSTANLGVGIIAAMTTALSNIIRFESTYNASNNKLTIGLIASLKPTQAFKIYTDEELKLIAPSLVGRSMNTMLKNTVPKAYDNTDHVTGYIDIYPVRNIYMTASGLGNFNTMSVAGDRNIVKQIPVTASHGEVIFDQTVTGMDYLDCSRQTLSRLSFTLRDVYGTVLELNGNHISFSIVFSRVQDGS